MQQSVILSAELFYLKNILILFKTLKTPVLNINKKHSFKTSFLVIFKLQKSILYKTFMPNLHKVLNNYVYVLFYE